LPDLAGSLNNLATFLSELDQSEEAWALSQEAVITLAPYFFKNTLGFAGFMDTMVRNYLKRCEETGREPDMKLLSPIIDVLVKLAEANS
jgi:hypothetical protein